MRQQISKDANKSIYTLHRQKYTCTNQKVHKKIVTKEAPVRTFLSLIRPVPAVDLFVAELRSVDTTTRPVATELIGSTSRTTCRKLCEENSFFFYISTTLLVAQVATLDSAITSLASRKTKPGGGAVEPGARAAQLVRQVRALRLPVALDRLLHARAVRALVAALDRH